MRHVLKLVNVCIFLVIAIPFSVQATTLGVARGFRQPRGDNGSGHPVRVVGV